MPMRIAYLINQYPAVSHSFIRTEIRELEKLGLQIDRIAMRGWDGENVDPIDTAERDQTRYVLQGGSLPLIIALARKAVGHPARFMTALSMAWHLSRGGERGLTVHLIYLAEACLINRWLHRNKVDHVHAHFGSNAAAVALLVRKLGGPTYSFTVHGPEEFDKPLQLKLSEKISAAKFVVAITSFCRSQLFRWAAPRDWSKIAVVHCAIDPRFQDTPTFHSAYPRRLICVGRLCEQKGQLLLIGALSSLRDRGFDIDLVLAGDGEMRNEIERAVVAADLTDSVTITGWIGSEKVRELLDEAVALVLPSFGEGLPIVIMEAMARRRPVITTYIAGIPELVRDGIEGLLVPAGDEAALADAIERLILMNESTMDCFGDAAFERVHERHSAVSSAAKLVRLFEGLGAS